jgi:stage II sporulation protein AA (anti-sigma F factor antagonist)
MPTDEPMNDRDGYGGRSRAAPVNRLDRSVRVPAVSVFLSGEIDCDCAGVVEETLMAAVEVRGVRHVVVDLTDLRFMDARCAGVLLGVRRWAAQRGVAMNVACVSGIPRRVLEILGLYDELRASFLCPSARTPIRPEAS